MYQKLVRGVKQARFNKTELAVAIFGAVIILWSQICKWPFSLVIYSVEYLLVPLISRVPAAFEISVPYWPMNHTYKQNKKWTKHGWSETRERLFWLAMHNGKLIHFSIIVGLNNWIINKNKCVDNRFNSIFGFCLFYANCSTPINSMNRVDCLHLPFLMWSLLHLLSVLVFDSGCFICFDCCGTNGSNVERVAEWKLSSNHRTIFFETIEHLYGSEHWKPLCL